MLDILASSSCPGMFLRELPCKWGRAKQNYFEPRWHHLRQAREKYRSGVRVATASGTEKGKCKQLAGLVVR